MQRLENGTTKLTDISSTEKSVEACSRYQGDERSWDIINSFKTDQTSFAYLIYRGKNAEVSEGFPFNTIETAENVNLCISFGFKSLVDSDETDTDPKYITNESESN